MGRRWLVGGWRRVRVPRCRVAGGMSPDQRRCCRVTVAVRGCRLVVGKRKMGTKRVSMWDWIRCLAGVRARVRARVKRLRRRLTLLTRVVLTRGVKIMVGIRRREDVGADGFETSFSAQTKERRVRESARGLLVCLE